MARKSLPGPSHSRSLGQKPRDIDHVLAILGIDGRQSGGELSARCPLHDERRPSFCINLGTGLWKCHARCGGGNLAQLVAQATGKSPAVSKRWLNGIQLSDPPEDSCDDDDGWYDENHYFKWFREPPEYALKDRGISPEAAADLSIRWDKWTTANGLYGNGWAHDPSWGAWILPIRHPDTHDLLGWQTKIVGEVADGKEETKTTRGTRKSRTLFGIDCFDPGDPVIVVESPLDVAVIRTAGFPALASFGAAVSRSQRKLLANRASKVVLAMDNDDAGWDSYRKLVKAPEFTGTELYRFSYGHVPHAKDPGDMSDAEIREGLRTAKRITR
jgi:Toprim-like/CHC2 zinc finger